MFNRKYIFKRWIFHGYVSLPQFIQLGIFGDPPGALYRSEVDLEKTNLRSKHPRTNQPILDSEWAGWEMGIQGGVYLFGLYQGIKETRHCPLTNGAAGYPGTFRFPRRWMNLVIMGWLAPALTKTLTVVSVCECLSFWGAFFFGRWFSGGLILYKKVPRVLVMCPLLHQHPK